MDSPLSLVVVSPLFIFDVFSHPIHFVSTGDTETRTTADQQRRANKGKRAEQNKRDSYLYIAADMAASYIAAGATSLTTKEHVYEERERELGGLHDDETWALLIAAVKTMRLPTSKTRPTLLTLYRDIVCVDEGGGDIHDSPRTMIVCASSRIDASSNNKQHTHKPGEHTRQQYGRGGNPQLNTGDIVGDSSSPLIAQRKRMMTFII